MSVTYALVDTETFNLVGSFRSRDAALRVVAETVNQYGETSDEALTLVLYCQNDASDDAYVAEGEALVRLALGEAGSGPSGNEKARRRVTGASSGCTTGSGAVAG